MTSVATFNSGEANAPKQATVYNDFTYDTITNGGVLEKLNEVGSIITDIYNDVIDIASKYQQLQALYGMFTNFNEAMNVNTAALSNNFSEIQTAYNQIISVMNEQIAVLQQQDTTLMEDLDAINQQLAQGAEVTDPTMDASAQAQAARAAQEQAAAQAAQDQAAAEAAQQAQAAQAALAAQQAATVATPEAGFMTSAGVGTAGGFVMPTGQNLETVYKIIAAEGGNISPNEAMNIASTMINRARTGGWSGGNDIYKIATAKNQYVVYQNGNYASASLSPASRAAVDQLFASAAAGGGTVHPYSSFRSNGSTSYGGTILEPGGNRYA